MLRKGTIAIAGPAAVTLLAVPETHPPKTVVALLFVLVVVVVARVAGAGAGIAASIVSFLALNYFFTEPLHSFVVGTTEDLVALVVLAVVGATTGLLLATAVKEKARAERREQQTLLMNRFTNKLLSGAPLADVLQDVARELRALLNLASCEVETSSSHARFVSEASDPGSPFEVPLQITGEKHALLRAIPRVSRPLDADERAMITNVAGQLSLALESMRLSDEVTRVQVDAETNRLRAALFSGVTHDLRTPLAAITASVTSLMEGAGFTTEERDEHLDTIRQEAEHLNRVVTNLLDLSRLRAGALVPKKLPGAIDELIEAVVARMQPLLGGREVQLNLRDGLPEMPMDLVQIDQVLTNLIENAVKFTPRSSPIAITAVGTDTVVRVTVADRGPGIPAEDRARVFQAFERGAGEVAGTGLGLAIAQAVVIAHGGRMWAQQNPGGGAALTFELPVSPNGRAG